MAHFRISLPNNLEGEVRRGKIKKMQFALKLFRSKPFQKEEHTGYIVKVNSASGRLTEFHLMKTSDGKWLQKGENDWVHEGEGTVHLVIKKAIDEYEKENR